MSQKKVIVKIKGGIGNQLFCYATALRLAIKNNAELIVDNVSGYVNDTYNREYELNNFNIRARTANRSERYEPFGTYRRQFFKKLNSFLPFEKRTYIAEKELGYDSRMLNYQVQKEVYLDGYWQSEKYFKDIEQEIRKDLQVKKPKDKLNQELSNLIQESDSVALHIRWFDDPTQQKRGSNISMGYYQKAIEKIENTINGPHFFIFSDNPQAAINFLNINDQQATLMDHNLDKAYADLWLMQQCKHFIIANSTFSWWGAWLSQFKDKFVIAPEVSLQGEGSWGFDGLIPSEWTTL